MSPPISPPVRMDVPTLIRALEAVVELRRELQGHLEGLAEGLEGELSGDIDKENELKQRMLGLVVATQEQLAIQRWGPPSSGGEGPGASTQVRGSAKLQLA
jgi:hypothetical protein